ncbi:pantoate--beta-alanine ligase [Hyphomonas sp. FCG-A18]|jgi:pantoate--beta-alanine ligase|uniref:pantoate--beta-alanine ligase n=1 Tax=Hyphomonas sp. FCG-A18 TaxID=3080019 RepID=UPI002B2FEEE1|nr:pantoate--beta-alanine ligase [Hyphomonas sp. FCG-A18]
MKKKPVLVRTLKDLRETLAPYRREGRKIGFVPTMGALHDGHISLVELAREKSDVSVVSIFVNPTQFAEGEDLDTYPRTEEADIARLAAVDTDIVYLPSVEEMYPEGSVTNVRVEALSDLLDGIYRPHFFYGVATVVARLFIHVQPDVAAFGQKDYQQLQIIRRMVRDLGFPIEILGGETVRDPDGLAQSSRNAYLSAEERAQANAISTALNRAAKRIELGVSVRDALTEARSMIEQAGFDRLDYVSAVDPETLQDLPDAPVAEGYEGRLLAAAWMGKTRLIDNLGFKRS